jgi:hypothetical protein
LVIEEATNLKKHDFESYMHTPYEVKIHYVNGDYIFHVSRESELTADEMQFWCRNFRGSLAFVVEKMFDLCQMRNHHFQDVFDLQISGPARDGLGELSHDLQELVDVRNRLYV